MFLKKLTAVAMAAFLSVGLLVSCGAKEEQPTETTAASAETTPAETTKTFMGAKEPPAIEVERLDGTKVRLKDLKGKAVMVVIGASWCPDCREEYPIIEEVYQNYKDHPDVEILVTFLFDNQGRETMETVKALIDENKYTFPVVVAEKTPIRDAMQISWIPTVLVIGRDGMAVEMGKNEAGEIEYYRLAKSDKAFLIEKLEAALNQK